MDITTVANLTTAAIVSVFAAAKAILAVVAYFKKGKLNA